DQRVRQVQDGEGGGRGARVGERRLVEEDVRADPRSECPVPGLGDQPGREQTAETPFGQDASQLGEERRARYAPAQLPSERGQHRHPFSLRRAGCWPARPLSSAKVSRCAVQRLRQRSTSPRMNFSTRSWATSSPYCGGGQLMKGGAAEGMAPPIPRSLAIFAARMASMIT